MLIIAVWKHFNFSIWLGIGCSMGFFRSCRLDDAFFAIGGARWTLGNRIFGSGSNDLRWGASLSGCALIVYTLSGDPLHLSHNEDNFHKPFIIRRLFDLELKPVHRWRMLHRYHFLINLLSLERELAFAVSATFNRNQQEFRPWHWIHGFDFMEIALSDKSVLIKFPPFYCQRFDRQAARWGLSSKTMTGLMCGRMCVRATINWNQFACAN